MKVIYQRRSDHVAEIIFNRPERKNAVDFDLMEQFRSALIKLQEDETITVLIIRGEGDAFCGGGDLGSFHQLKTKEEALTMLQPMCEVLKILATFPVVTVAYINGSAVGGGAEIASACDFRFAKGDGVVGFIQGNLHITTGWGGATLLKKRVGTENALLMLGTAKRWTMDEVEQLGFIRENISLKDLYEWTDHWKGQAVVKAYKNFFFTETEKEELFLAMDKEVDACASLWEKDEHHVAVQAFLNKK
ncbi:MAG: enoyl-CoA hydratase/isomerase family protein [Bacillus sp. (in: Bacteria)]|nr:enoyl-CoA hydratase/isomerase family protein [Bacillus sp. (in: firmicutes)]